jgi:hypothetical protein
VAVLYAAKASGASASDLYTVNPATAGTTSVGASGYAITGLAFDPTTGILYGVTSPGSGASPQSLITLDTTTGAGTVVGGMGATVADICFDSTGVLYGWKPSGNRLVTIDKATGTLTVLGASGVSGSSGNGLACDSSDTVWLFPGGTGGDLYTVNKSTGTATDQGTLDDGLASSNTVGAASFDGSDVLYGVCIATPSILFTVGTISSGTYPLLTAGTFGSGGWDALAWEPSAGGGGIIPGRVLIAFDDTALEPDPTWTRIDDTENLVAGIDIRRGRQTELDQTETSTATVMLNDTDGLFDPANPGSPYFGLIDGKQILLQCWNPVAAVWVPQYRGVIDDYSYDFSGAVNAAGEPLIATISLECVDAFDYLAGVEMIPGLFGDPVPPTGSEGVVFYEDTDFQTRLRQLATRRGMARRADTVLHGKHRRSGGQARPRRQRPSGDARRGRRRVPVPRQPVHEQGRRRVRARTQGALYTGGGCVRHRLELHPVEGR